jgi:hypothetical protein
MSLLANIVMAWNTAKMPRIFDRWAERGGPIPSELIGSDSQENNCLSVC